MCHSERKRCHTYALSCGKTVQTAHIDTHDTHISLVLAYNRESDQNRSDFGRWKRNLPLLERKVRKRRNIVYIYSLVFSLLSSSSQAQRKSNTCMSVGSSPTLSTILVSSMVAAQKERSHILCSFPFFSYQFHIYIYRWQVRLLRTPQTNNNHHDNNNTKSEDNQRTSLAHR